MSLGGGQTQTPVAGSNKYADIMELMRRRNAMNNSTYTGGFNPYAVAVPTTANTYDELARLQALANANRGGGPQGGSELGQTGFDGYGPNSSPLSSPMKGSFGYQALDTYGNLLGGMLPGGFLAQALAQSMNPSQVAEAGKLSAQALQDAIAGYTSGEMFGAPPSDPSTFGGGGYGTPTGEGGYGKTSATGAGIAANPMGIDPATAQGQQAYGGGPESDGGGGTGVGGGFGGNDGSGEGFGGIYSRGGYVNKMDLKGPKPMGADDGYGALKDGEFVINPNSVSKYGIDLMNAINAGKISKGKLRGLLEA